MNRNNIFSNSIAYIAFGSNVGDKLKNITKAIEVLSKNSKLTIQKCSSIYETKPLGISSQPNFYNGAFSVTTEFNPDELLKILKQTEMEVGRNKTVKWGPREIDLDLILFDNLKIEKDNLLVPHKSFTERDFVLVPLIELENDLVHPQTGKRLTEYLNFIETNYIIRKIEFQLNYPRSN